MDPPENLPPPPPLSLPEMSTPSQAGPPEGAPSGSVGGHGGGSSSRRPSGGPGPAMKPPPRYPQVMRNGNYGTKGSPVSLEVNHFKVAFKPQDEVYHYNITIEPEIKKGLSRKIMNKLCDSFGAQFLNGKRFAYDGEKSLFTVGSLPFTSHEFPVSLDDDRRRHSPRAGGSPSGDDNGRPTQRRRLGGRDFSVVFKYAAKLDMNAVQSVLDGKKTDKAQDALRVLDIMLREHAAKQDYLLIRDCYFHNSLGPVIEIGEGVQAWRGFHVSFRPTCGRFLTLNFDLSTTTVIKPSPVMTFVQEHCKKDVRSFQEMDWRKAQSCLKGVMVETQLGRKHKVFSITRDGCSKLRFQKKIRDENGNIVGTEETTVTEYFQTDRSIQLKHPNFPALDLGRANKPMYVPVELCKIVSGQRYKKNLSGVQRKNHIDNARQGPAERKSICQDAMKTNNYNQDELVREFNVSIEPKMMVVKGRILEAPQLMFGNREEKPSNGRWNFNSKKMKVGSKIGNWAVVNFTRNPAKPIADQLKAVCASKGMELAEVEIFEEHPPMRNRSAEDRVHAMMEKMKSSTPTFCLCILPEKSSDLYAPFKRAMETVKGIVSQCIVPPRQVKDQYLTNVALKINLKSGGYNTVLAAEEKKMLPKVSQVPTIIFGLDVSHGSPGDSSSPSIAAAVASMNWPNFSTYTTRVRAQAPKTEIIEGLYVEDPKSRQPGGMVIELLKDFYSTCKAPQQLRKPAQILIYRDGVSESQFEAVLEEEVHAFKRACKNINRGGQDYNPKITLVVVQKRHHTRFFPVNGSDNVKPGTVVDRDVCHPRDNDFFLCSHNGLIGTTRPTHYHVLYDEIGFTVDELQHLTHCLCYSYAKCTTAVSVVAPAYYAHLAAQHFRNFVASDGSGSESSRSRGDVKTNYAPLPNVCAALNKTMFYT